MTAAEPNDEAYLANVLAFVAAGCAVFPVNRIKQPLTEHGFKDATTDPGMVEGYWRQYGHPNFAWALPDGTIAVDVDDQAAFDETGLELPETAWQPTRTEGHRHLVYELPPDVKPKQVAKPKPGIDYRIGGKGYLVLYDDPRGLLGRRAPATEWMYEQAAGGHDGPREVPDELGTRDDILLALGKLAATGTGLSESDYLRMLIGWYASGRIVDLKPHEPWTEADFEKLAGEAAKWDEQARADKAWADAFKRSLEEYLARKAAGEDAASGEYPEPEDRGDAVRSADGAVDYVTDIARPGRITVVAAEEGAGKTQAMDELAIRVAVAGGSFAETWPVNVQGGVLILSEMHPDDDYDYEQKVLDSLGLERSALRGRLYRMPAWTMVDGEPALTVVAWRRWLIGWMRAHGIVLLIVDTVSAAMQIEPFGKEILEAYGWLHELTEGYPALAIVLDVHMRKPTMRGERGLADVLGQWGRHNDITLLMENDGPGFSRTKLTVRKRTNQRRIVADKVGGLLVNPSDITDATGGGRKVPLEKVLAHIQSHPGQTYDEIAKALDVSKPTAIGYVLDLFKNGQVTRESGSRGQIRVFPTVKP